MLYVTLRFFHAVRKEQWSISWWGQFNVLLSRSLKERRYEVFNYLRIFQVVSVATLAGLLWWQTPLSHIQDRVSTSIAVTTFSREMSSGSLRHLPTYPC